MMTRLTKSGAGRVLRVGPNVTKVKVGDPVLLSYHSCGSCQSCLKDRPALCPRRNDFMRASGLSFKSKATGETIQGFFFGQSSFSRIGLVREASVIPAASFLKDPSSNEELKVLAPFGCGMMTGTGAVVNVAKPEPGSEIMVLGLGGVGLGALMTAKISGCKTIIAVDRIQSRLDLAKELGATHTFNTAGHADLKVALEAAAKEVSLERAGVDFVIDTTAFVPLINAAIEAIRPGGRLLLIGVPNATDSIELKLGALLTKVLTVGAVMMGNAAPGLLIPKMVEWYHSGQYPVDKLVGFFDAEKIETAVQSMKDGSVVKPVLVW